MSKRHRLPAMIAFTCRSRVLITMAPPPSCRALTVTTSTQQTVLTGDEIRCLRDVAQGLSHPPDDPALGALVAKGMLDADDASRHTLTPAGRHAVDVAGPGMVPGIDE